MEKVKMKAFIVNLMSEWKDTTILISCIKEGVRYVLQETDAMVCDSFDATLPCVLNVLREERAIFGLREDGRYLTLKYPENLEKYVESWEVSDEVKSAIKDYIIKIKDPLYYTSIDVGQAEENEEIIKSDSNYIEWICKYLLEFSQFTNRDFYFAKEGKDIANIIMLINLYNLVSRYCTKNLISCWHNGKDESYMIKYRTASEMKYFEIIKVSETGLIKVLQHNEIDRAIYFPDVAMDVPAENLKEKQDKLKSFKQQFEGANNIDIPYYKVRELLDKAYGLDEED